MPSALLESGRTGGAGVGALGVAVHAERVRSRCTTTGAGAAWEWCSTWAATIVADDRGDDPEQAEHEQPDRAWAV